jgi:hypothetical protein
MLDPLHDPTRLAHLVETIAARLLNKHFPGRSTQEQLELADNDMKSLIKAAGLLSDSFALLTIYFNPQAASYGRKSYISLHGLLMKLVSIFRIQDDAEGDPIRIFLEGQSFRQVRVFESFKLIPFALISNAVKYSLLGGIRVTVVERQRGIEVVVESHGPWIEPDELDSIFEKRVRGKWATHVAQGTGVGLYLAQVVAYANGTEITVTSQRTGEKTADGIPLATNRFRFELGFG